jgi:hypothetical protein
MALAFKETKGVEKKEPLKMKVMVTGFKPFVSDKFDISEETDERVTGFLVEKGICVVTCATMVNRTHKGQVYMDDVRSPAACKYDVDVDLGNPGHRKIASALSIAAGAFSFSFLNPSISYSINGDNTIELDKNSGDSMIKYLRAADGCELEIHYKFGNMKDFELLR